MRLTHEVKPRRSILVIGTLAEPIPPKFYGGIEELIYFVVEYLVKRGWNVILLDVNLESRRDLNKLKAISKNSNFNLIRVPAITPKINGIILLLRALIATYHVIKILKLKKIDVIHTFYFYPLYPLTMLLKMTLKIMNLKHIKIVFTTAAHYPWLARNISLRSKLIIPFRKLMKMYADKIVTLSRQMVASIFYYLNLPVNKFNIIHDCYDDDEYDYSNAYIKRLKTMADEFRHKLGLNDKLVILYLARIEPIKGIDDLINAVYSIKEKLRKRMLGELKIIVAGKSSNQQLARYKCIVDKLGLRDVISIVGPVSRSAVKFLYLMADLYVLPTKLEAGPPISLLQAVGVGTPAITTKYALIPELNSIELAIINEPISENLSTILIKIINNRDVLKELWKVEYASIKANYGKLYCGKMHEKLYNALVYTNS